MKNYLKITSVLGVIALLAPLSALAASISLSPTSVSVNTGDTFSISVVADPASTKLYSVRANVSFDSSLVQVTNFSFAGTWISIAQPGYDSIDNATGVLIKAAGYPGGFTSATKLGTITFKALKAGTATISSTNSSLLLDADSKNQISGGQGSASVSITTTPVIVTPPVVKTVEVVTKAKATTETPVKTKISTITPIIAPASTTSVATTVIATSSLLAAVNGAITLGTGSPIVSALFSAVVVLLVMYGFYYYRYYRRVR